MSVLKYKVVNVVYLLILYSSILFAQETGHIQPLDSYPVGGTAELFNYEFVSVGYQEKRIVFSPDGKEFIYEVAIPAGKYVCEQKGLFGYSFTMYSRFENGTWTEPTEFLNERNFKIEYPFFSPDGNRIIFNSFGPVNTQSKSSSKLWFIDKQEDGWSEPSAINFGKDYAGNGCIYPSAAANGNLYFAQFPDGVHGYIYISKYENGKYSLPEKLIDSINEFGGNHPFISPDESFLIFDSERPGATFGSSDLYISFKENNSNWTTPKNLGAGINSKYDERRAFLSFDGKYLFFASDRIIQTNIEHPLTINKLRQLMKLAANGNHHIYWIDAKILEELREKKKQLN